MFKTSNKVFSIFGKHFRYDTIDSIFVQDDREESQSLKIIVNVQLGDGSSYRRNIKNVFESEEDFFRAEEIAIERIQGWIKWVNKNI